jgi:aspartate aminotransferase-like enzyme
MPGLLPNIDPDGLLEYSVVYTDRSLNHMSSSFQQVMNDVSSSLKKVYNAESVVLFQEVEPMAWRQLLGNLLMTKIA